MNTIVTKMDNISAFFKNIPDNSLRTAISKIAENPYAEKILEKTPLQDMIFIGRKYNTAPEIYDDVFKGKIKFFAKGMQDEPFTVFKEEYAKNLNDVIEPNSFMNSVVNLFDIYTTTKNPVKTIIIGLKDKTIKTAFFDKFGNIIKLDSISTKNHNTDSPIMTLIKAADKKIIRLTRD